MAKHVLVLVHRWLTLVLLPFILFLIVTGGLLALRPVVVDLTSGPPAEAPMAVEDAASLVRLLDPDQRARSLYLEEPATAVLEFTRQGQRETIAFDIETALPLETRLQGAEFFHHVADLHKHFVSGWEVVLEIATWGLLVIVLVGPVLAWPRLKNTVLGWHMALGWGFFPVMMVLSITAVLLLLNIGGPTLPEVDRTPGRFPLPIALEQAARDVGLTHVERVRTMKSAGVVVHGFVENRPVVLIATRQGTTEVSAHPGLLDELHTGTWAGGWSGALYALTSLVMVGLVGTGLWSWGRRRLSNRRRSGDADAEVLVAWASQTGTAARFGQATVDSLRASGLKVAGASLAGMAPADLMAYRAVLILASTAGEGQVPEPVRPFYAALLGANLTGLRFALLALGDRRYPHFCAGGLALRDRLVAAGGEDLLPMVMVDGDPSAPWTAWLETLSGPLGIQAAALMPPQGEQAVSLVLEQRRQLNDPADPETNEVWELIFRSTAPLAFHPGDLLLCAPTAEEPPRPYSIGSSAARDPYRLRLTVSLVTKPDGQGGVVLGKMSGQLCRGLKVGEPLTALLRPHPTFNPPDDPGQAVIMVATGCGVAPFTGFIEDKVAGVCHGPMWLFFGNSKRRGDFFYGPDLETWHRDGVLTHLSTAFSLDPEDGPFIQDRMVAEGAEVYDWLTNRGAILYVCGRVSTVGQGTRWALLALLQQHGGLSEPEAQRHLQSWQAEGRLRFDLID